MAFTAVLRFGLSPALLATGEKCRLMAVGRRTSGGKLPRSIGTRADTLEGLEGVKKNRPQKGAGRLVEQR